MYQRIPVIEALASKEFVFIDVRTPLEFAEGAIPGAINIPILSNEERIEVGTLYKQRGASVARERGLEIVSPKFPSIYEAIKNISKGKLPVPVVYCWRGGLRSQTVATILDLVGLSVAVIEGGYKAYRNEVLKVLNSHYPFELVTLYGLTGAGKTALLHQMREAGLPVIDLEGLANHRGSVFGHVGILKKQTQQQFEALLFNEIKKYSSQKVVFIEGESQRIGPVFLPKIWMEQMKQGRKIFIKSSLERRRERILQEYFYESGNPSPEKIQQITEALDKLKKHLGGKLHQEIETALQEGQYDVVVTQLLESYYDKNYKYSAVASESDFILTLSADGEDCRGLILELKKNIEGDLVRATSCAARS